MLDFFTVRGLSHPPYRQAEGPPLIGDPLLLIHNIRSFLPTATWESYIPWWKWSYL